MKIGFIGVGGVAQPHLQNLAQMKGVKIHAVCDIQPERVKATTKQYGAKPYDDYRKMLKGESLDACYVCVIPAAHGTIELDLAKARLPFYAEKPVHLDLKVCAKVIEELEKGGTVNGVGYHWRYIKTVQEIKKFTGKRRIMLVNGSWYGGMPGVPWWRQMKLSGGQLVEQTTHIVDLARYLAGEVHTVYAAATRGAMTDVENYDIDDASLATLYFDSGAIGSITSGCIAGQDGGRQADITLRGRDWQAWTDAGSGLLSDAKGQRKLESGQSWAEMLGNGDRTFVNAVKSGNGSKILSTYVSGAQTLAVTLAANQSMKTGKPVKVQRFL